MGGGSGVRGKVRLGWLDTFERSRALVPVVANLREQLAAARSRPRGPGRDGWLVAGRGSDRPYSRYRADRSGRDRSPAGRCRLADRLERTVVVVASKSGSTVETDSHRRAYLQAFQDAGIADPGRHFVVITDPHSRWRPRPGHGRPSRAG